MKAIRTKYLSATETRGARIKAMADGVTSVTISYPDELTGAKCHFAAVKELVSRNNLKWETDGMVCGGMPDQSGWVFCFPNATIDSM